MAATGTIGREEAGCAPARCACRVSLFDQWAVWVARRALGGPPKAEPGRWRWARRRAAAPLGYEAQNVGTVEPQCRLAPHLHMAIRGAVPRAVIRQVIAATYHQVWWTSTDQVRFEGDHLPVWQEQSGRYLDPATGELLPTWDEALDAIGPHDQPLQVARFGPKFDAQGVLAGSKDASRCIGYLTKYLVKDIGTCHTPDTEAQRDHVIRLVDALRYEPCSPTCANWLRYGITPKNPRKGMVPGACKGQGPPAQPPRLRRAPRPRLPQVVRQDPRRPPRPPQAMADGHARPFGNRGHRPLPVGTGHSDRFRLPGSAETASPGRRRADAVETGTRRGPATSPNRPV